MACPIYHNCSVRNTANGSECAACRTAFRCLLHVSEVVLCLFLFVAFRLMVNSVDGCCCDISCGGFSRTRTWLNFIGWILRGLFRGCVDAVSRARGHVWRRDVSEKRRMHFARPIRESRNHAPLVLTPPTGN